MSVLRLEALNQLSECITNQIPELRGAVCAGPAESNHRLEFPSLSITPIRFKYFPDQAAEIGDLNGTDPQGGHLPNTVLLNVGRHEGTIQLRLGAKTNRQRATLEQKILDVFLMRPGSPGILVTSVPQCHNATVAWELDADEWESEMAFNKKWYSIMVVACQLPALITRGSVHTIEEIRLTLTDDLSTEITQVPADAQETVSVAIDGTLTSAAGP